MLVIFLSLAAVLLSSMQPQPANKVMEWCIRPYQNYLEEGIVWSDGPNRHQITGGRLDLRPWRNTSFGEPGLGIFAYTEFQSGPDIVACFPPNVNYTLSPTERSILENDLWVSGPLASTKLGDALFELFTTKADRSGLFGPMALSPGPDRILKLHLGNTLVRSKRINFDSDEWNATRFAIQQKYRGIRSDTLAGFNTPGSHQRYLAVLSEIWRTEDTDQFIPSDLPRETPLPHSTTQNETWTGCADSDNPDCDLDWTEIQFDVDIVSNALENGGTLQNEALAEDAVSSSSHYVEGDLTVITEVGTREVALITLKTCGNVTRTYVSGNIRESADELRIEKRTGGSGATIASRAETIAAATWTDTRITADGNDFTLAVSGFSDLTGSDTHGFTGLCGGVILRHTDGSGTARLDNWTISDLAATRRRLIVTWPF